MIDIKAIRAAAKDTPYVWMSLLQPKTVLALCDEIEKLQKENEKLLEIFKVKHHAALRFFEKEAALEAEIERLRKDAARYRFMRDRPNHEIKRRKGRVAFVPRFTNYEYDTFTTLDAAIDAAMESKSNG